MRVNQALASLAVVALGTLWTGASVGSAQQDAAKESLPPIWTGVYTAEQAEQGKVPFKGLCRRCHSEDLNGSERAPALRGASFMENWEQQDLDRLRRKIHDTMPPDDPGKLSEDDYVHLVSVILQGNGYPAGTTALDTTALSSILLAPKPGEERALRNFSLVQVVGCLTQGADQSWTLTRASSPVLGRDRPATADELKSEAAKPMGNETYQLVSVAPFQPDARSGQRIAIKGLLYKAPDKSRVNVSSLQLVGNACGE
jgi:hypothetical protein